MKMKTEAIMLTNRLIENDWFYNVGHPIENSSLARINTWPKAIISGKSENWENITLDCKNHISESVADHLGDSHWGIVWNNTVKIIKSYMNPQIPDKLDNFMQAINGSEENTDEICWNILGACLEIEFTGMHNSKFFTELVKWYLMGHYPCGWEGDFPQGRLIVF